MTFRVNFSDVDGDGFEALPSGTYHVKITDGELREAGENAKNPGSQYINWEFTVQSGDLANRKLWTNSSLLPQALFRLKQMFKATGHWDDEDLNADDFNFDIDDAIGLDLKVVVTTRMYEEEKQNDIKRFKPISAEEIADTSLMP